MKSFLEQNLLILALALALALATVSPHVGLALDSLGLTQLFLVVIFVLQGVGLDVRAFRKGTALARALLWGALVAYALAPVAGFALMRVTHFADSDRVGFMLMCCSTPTIVSGIVIATRAGGDTATALFLTVLLNALGIVTLPFNLSWTLGGIYPIDQLALFKKLLFFILLPSILGFGLRSFYPRIVKPSVGVRKHGPVVLLGLTVLAAVSPHSAALRGLSLPRMLSLLWPALLVHGLVLTVAYVVGRFLWRINEGTTLATAFVTSQKSLPVAIVVWSSVFLADYPLALIPVVVFYASEMVLDSLIARWLNKPASRLEGSSSELAG